MHPRFPTSSAIRRSPHALSRPTEAAPRYDFANLLFAGPCNRACPWCIGHQLPAWANENSLDVFPPKGIDTFLAAVHEHQVPEIIFTGTTSDPQVYRHQGVLIDLLRAQTPAGTRLSIHTNGVRTLSQLDTFNRYNKATLSFPSFNPDTYEKLMGSRGVPDLPAIARAATIPLKVSCVVNEYNIGEIPDFVTRLEEIGIRRLAIRRLYGTTQEWDILPDLPVTAEFRGNPVRYYRNLEITYWRFESAEMRSLNLYANGLLSDSYLLAQTREFQAEGK